MVESQLPGYGRHSIPDDLRILHLLHWQRVAPETIEPPAREIVNMLKSIELAAERHQKIYVLHFPRGASPILAGLRHAWFKLYGHQPLPFETLTVPVSRENTHDREVKAIMEERLSDIKAGSVVYYFDEVFSGRNATANIEDLIKVLKKRNCELRAHLLVGHRGDEMDPRAKKKLTQMRRFKHGVKIILHDVPEPIPWTDNTPVLGQNWALNFKFPFDLVQHAVQGAHSREDVKKFGEWFNQEYEGLVRAMGETRFRRIQFPSWEFANKYARRDLFAMFALKRAADYSGFSRKHRVEFKGRTMTVDGTPIKIPRLKTHLNDSHPSHEIKRGRSNYHHFFQSDPTHLLIDFGPPRRIKGHVRSPRRSQFATHSADHHLAGVFMPQREHYRFRRAWNAAIGKAVHELRFKPSRQKRR